MLLPSSHRLAWLLAAVLCTGCASTRFVNTPLVSAEPNPERRSIDVSDAQRPLVLVAISGGGSRAAALGWTVLSQLRDQTISTGGGTPHSLADDVGVVSSVSGGSVIAAHFALAGKEGLEDFRKDFLVPDNMEIIAADFLNPFAILGRSFAGESRTDAIRDMFDRELFHGKTFAAVNQPGKPYLILNATEMSTREVFAFTPGRFDDICASLDDQKLSVGVAASSAVPIAVAPIALTNFSGPGCPAKPASSWPEKEVRKTYSPFINLEAFKRARYAVDLRRSNDAPGPSDPPDFAQRRRIPYVYLLDGGMADNLAVHGLMEVLSAPDGPHLIANPLPGTTMTPGSLLAAINGGALRTVVVIVINARAEPANDLALQATRPGIIPMISAVTSQPIDSATTSIASQMSVLMAQFNAASGGATGDPKFTGLRVYPVMIDFDQLPVATPEQRALREKVKNVPTSWKITAGNLEAIQQAGTVLLQRHPCYERLLLDLSAPASFVDANWAKTGCRFPGD